jgi:membrane-associated protease RseP (regulator of RpoE activity)
MTRWLSSCLAWQIVLCLIGIAACLVPTCPRTGTFWGLLRDWTSVTPGRIHVHSVEPKSPAAAAGLVPGDWVVAVDGKSFTSVEALDDALRALRPGSQVALSVERGLLGVDLHAAGQAPEVQAIYFYHAQLVSLLVLLALAVLLVATQPLRPALCGAPCSSWRSASAGRS